MKKVSAKLLAVAATGTLLVTGLPNTALADTGNVTIAQDVGSGILDHTDYFGGVPASTPVTVDIVLKIQNQDKLSQYITNTVTPGNNDYRHYVNVDEFKAKYAPSPATVNTIVQYLKSYGISSSVYSDNLVITASGTAGQFNSAFNVNIQNAEYNGKKFHATKQNPTAPANVANSILCILGLSDYSNFASHTVKKEGSESKTVPANALTPTDLEQHYNATPLVQNGATGAGQTMGIVTLAGFNPEDAYTYWNLIGQKVKQNRISVTNVDNADQQDPSLYYNGYDETTLDVEQSGAIAPQANIDVYVGPNTDTGFVDAFAKAINDNKVQSLSVSWGESEQIINTFVEYNLETPEYAQAFNQLFMEAAAQGISTFAASGDAGSYDSAIYYDYGFGGLPGLFNPTVDNPADSPYITAAGGTTLPWQATLPNHTDPSKPIPINVTSERAWGWDYLFPYFDARGWNNIAHWAARYVVGSGGGFSTFFQTPDYQQGVSGVNTFAAETLFTPNSDGSSMTRNDAPGIVTGTGSGRNLPDVSMDADPETGYGVYMSDPGAPGQNSGWAQYGGTSFVAPQLNGLTALINSADNTQVGFWNPQIYRFAQQSSSPFTPLQSQTDNNNDYYTGQPGDLYNQATGLGIPNIAELAKQFATGSGQ